MSDKVARGVVLLHGLFGFKDRSERFICLSSVEQLAKDKGFTIHRFEWPKGFRLISTIEDPGKSFSAILARAFDEFLRNDIVGKYLPNDWVVIAHSAGGTVFYRWLVEYCSVFLQELHSPPGAAFTFASPYQCESGTIHLREINKDINVIEPPIDPTSIVANLPCKLVISTAASDEMFAASDVEFGQQENELVVKKVIDADHFSICNTSDAVQLVDTHLVQLYGDRTDTC